MKELNTRGSDWKRSMIRFLSAQTISLLGSSIVQYAIIWYITLTTSSGKMLTISTLCGFLPQILISLFAGVWIDRYDRRKMIMISDSVIAVSTLLLAAAFFTGHKSNLLLFAVLAVRSAGTGIQTPAVHAVIPQIVPSEHFMRVNGIHSTLSSIMMFIAPALSGAVLTAASLEATLLIDVITAVIGVGLTSTVYVAPYEKKENGETSGFQEMKRGFSYLRENSLVRRLLLFQLTVLFLISPSAFLTPLMVSRTFGQEVWRLTASEMTYSLGMVLGGILIAAWGGFKKKLNTTMTAGAAYGGLMIGLGTAPIFLIYLLCNTMIGITSPCYNAPLTVTVQEEVPSGMQGRVFSFMQIASSCALPFGMAVFGPLADVIRIQKLLTVSGTAVVLISFAVWKLNYFDKRAGF
ncbi:MFS transporter [Clostridium sp. AM58-1XD]|uniref:MFS transporter n=1 Tax=Clostridium sp. AM58-1XD TaxID=2292307 RepID=UPI000E4E979E|nr:MFS transporter [Clostridium sp. AM58-1XD]RGZ01910.1 MFS transporter [Clostridium sp. AM58-1XD]